MGRSTGLAVCLSALVVLITGPTKAFYWELYARDGHKVTVCEGQDALFPWQYTLRPEERAGTTNYTMMTLETYQPVWVRTTSTPEEEPGVRNATAADQGRYTVIMEVHTDGEPTPRLMRNSVELCVIAQPEVRGLWMTIDSDPELKNNKLQMVLQCGQFIFEGQPSVDVDFTLPDGRVVPHSFKQKVDSYTVYSLAITLPVQQGQYGCTVRTKSPAYTLCMYNRTFHDGNITVDAKDEEILKLKSSVGFMSDRTVEAAREHKKMADYIKKLEKALLKLAAVVIPNTSLSLPADLSKITSYSPTSHSFAAATPKPFSLADCPTLPPWVTTLAPVPATRFPPGPPPPTCHSLNASGVQELIVEGRKMTVYCDQETDKGGWTVIQRRYNGRENFFRDWSTYKNGFGNRRHEFWLGLENIYTLTSKANFELRVDLWDFKNHTAYTKYKLFYIDNEAEKYRLHVFGVNGTAGDGMKNGSNFCTKDRDNDRSPFHCAIVMTTGWWFDDCRKTPSNLNGRYKHHYTETTAGVFWFPWAKYGGLKKTEMKIRPDL